MLVYMCRTKRAVAPFVTRHLYAHRLKCQNEVVHIQNIGNVAQTHRLSGQQRGANNLQGLVFGALRCDVTFKAVTTFNQK